MTLLPNLEQHLMERADALGAHRRRRRYFTAAAVGSLTLSATAIAASTGVSWLPSLGRDSESSIAASTRALPAESERFSVLSRPVEGRDRELAAREGLRQLPPTVDGVHTEQVRFLGSSELGPPVFVIPVDRFDATGKPGLCLWVLDGPASGGHQCASYADAITGSLRLDLGSVDPKDLVGTQTVDGTMGTVDAKVKRTRIGLVPDTAASADPLPGIPARAIDGNFFEVPVPALP